LDTIACSFSNTSLLILVLKRNAVFVSWHYLIAMCHLHWLLSTFNDTMNTVFARV
jgi:hypothetical protein